MSWTQGLIVACNLKYTFTTKYLLRLLVIFSIILCGASVPVTPLCNTTYPEYVDIRSISPDLIVPNLYPNISFESPRPGARVYSRLPGWLNQLRSVSGSYINVSMAQDFFTLYLPSDWSAETSSRFPVIIELAGNGPYSSPWADVSTGRPDDTFLGYGITGGKGAVWASVPFLTAEGRFDQTYWWGCPLNDQACPNASSLDCISAADPAIFATPRRGCLSTTNTTASRAYLRGVVAHILETYNGDAQRVVLAGFSRGAIGVNYIGLADDETAALWAGTLAYAHYDGQPEDVSWPYPDSGPPASYERLKRLGLRPHFVCSELNSTLNQSKPYIQAAGFPVNATYVPTGFCNHNSEWVLRPSPAREQLRKWWSDVIGLN